MAVSKKFIADMTIDCDAATKECVMVHMGTVHKMVVESCSEYYTKMRRNVYQTPKSFLSFLQDYKNM